MASLKTPSKQHDIHFVSYFSILCKMDEKIGYGLMCCYPRLTSSIHGVFSFRSQLHPLVRIWSPLAQGDQDGNGHNATLEFTNQKTVLHLIKRQSLLKKRTAVGVGTKNLLLSLPVKHIELKLRAQG